MGSEIKFVVRKKEIEDFLRYTFDSPSRGPIQVSRLHDIGKYICSFVRHSTVPVKKPVYPDEHTVDLVIPDHPNFTHEYKYIYFTREDMVNINDYLQASFNLFFRSYMMAGEEMGFEQKQLLEAFMSATGVREVGKKFETFKKKDYRHRKKVDKIVVKSLHSIGFHSIKK